MNRKQNIKYNLNDVKRGWKDFWFGIKGIIYYSLMPKKRIEKDHKKWFNEIEDREE